MWRRAGSAPDEHDAAGGGVSRRQVLAAGSIAGLAVGATAVARSADAAAAPAAGAAQSGAAQGGAITGYALPKLHFADDRMADRFAGLYDAALTNIIGINTVYADPNSYNQSGLLAYPPGTLVRAGDGYPAPQRWTRDAAINAWSGATALSPGVARNTLFAVLNRDTSGSRDGHIVQQDNQWWDQIIWVVAAWDHYLATGDHDFLRSAYDAGTRTVAVREQTNFNQAVGLFQGPSLMNDGIAGYPAPPWRSGINSSFVLDYPGADKLMCLSTNCIYVAAYDALAAMADTLGHRGAAPAFTRRAAAVRDAVNSVLWRPQAGTYGYFATGDDTVTGVDTHQEGAGLALAILFGVADTARAQQVLRNAHWQPQGIVNVYPAFPRFDDDHPGRHNVMVWPMVHSLFGHAAAKAGRADLFGRSLTTLANLVRDSDNDFYELYNSVTGAVDGGWQTGGDGTLGHFTSQPNQAWSATGYTRLVHNGLFGMRYTTRGLELTPTLPAGWGSTKLTGFAYRSQLLDITLHGQGTRVRSFRIDGRHSEAVVPAGGDGRHVVEVVLE